jgi:hypothetical protein
MDVVIVVMSLRAVFFTERVFDGVIGGGNSMDDPFFHEGLKGPVDCHTVIRSGSTGFHVVVGQRRTRLDKDIQDVAAAFRNTQLVSFEYRCYAV